MLKSSISIDDLLDIYLQVAGCAVNSGEYSLAANMLDAAYFAVVNALQEPSSNMLVRLADLHLLIKERNKAEQIYNRAVIICRRSKQQNDWLVATIYDGLTEVYSARSEFLKAKKYCRRGLHLLQRMPGVSPILIAAKMRKLALLNLRIGSLSEAVHIYQRAMSFVET